MLSLLNNKTLSDQDKWSQYQQVLQRYLHFASQKRKPVQIPVIDMQTQKYNSLSPEELVATLPKLYKSKGLNLLKHISKRHEKIDWNDNGLVFIDGEIVPNSNIIDLLHDIVRSRKATQPQGWKQLLHALKDISTPVEFINNPFARHYYERLTGYVSPTEKSLQSANTSTSLDEQSLSPFPRVETKTTTLASSVRETRPRKWEFFPLK